MIGPPAWHGIQQAQNHISNIPPNPTQGPPDKHTHTRRSYSSPPQNTHPHHRCHAHPQYSNKTQGKTGVPMGLYHPSSTIVFSASHKLLLKIYYRNGAICYRGMTSTPHNHVPWCLTMGCSCVYSYFKLFTYFIRGNFYSSNVLLRERRGLVWETGDSIKSLSLKFSAIARLTY